MKYAVRLSVHMLMGGVLFSVLLGRLSLTGFLFGAALGFVLCLFLYSFYRQDADDTRIPFFPYCAYVASRIFLSSLTMIRWILSSRPLQASVRKEPACAGGRDRIIVSDSITLTPGTIALEESASEYTILCMNDDGGDHSHCFEEHLSGKGGNT